MPTLLWNATLMDVRDGSPQPDGAILVDDDTIVATGLRADFGQAPGAVMVDLQGGYVIPGLVDPHVHVAFSAEPDAIEQVGEPDDPCVWQRAVRNAGDLLRSGVTTAADCGGPGDLPLRLKQQIMCGAVAGPRLLVSLNPITTPDGHCHHFGAHARGVAQLRHITRCLIERGADFIKIMASGGGTPGATAPTTPQYDVAELRAVVEVAQAASRAVVAHARATASIGAAVEAGVQRVEHLTWEAADVGRTRSGAALAAPAPADSVGYDPAVAARMAERGIWADPTLPAGRRALTSDGVPAERRSQLGAAFAQRDVAYQRMAQETGLRLLAGTDAGTPLVRFDDFALATELLVQVGGYQPWQALRAATLWGAEALGVAATRGTLAAGKLVDLVVLGKDPSADISALREPSAVLLGGRWVRGGHFMNSEAYP